MREITWLVDTVTGELTVEGLGRRAASTLAAGLLAGGEEVNCARPRRIAPLSASDNARRVPDAPESPELSLQVFRIYHGSVTEGPGRRSVVQLSGCPHHCSSFIYSLK